MVIKGSHLFSYQKDVAEEVLKDLGTHKTVVVKSRRQVGKSLLISNLLLYFAINKEGSKNYCVSPTFKQAKKIYKSICKATAKSFNVVKSVNSSDLTIGLKNGSEIIFRSGEMRDNLRGETVTGLLCLDEASFISDSTLDIIRPWTDFHKAVTLMVSTPFVKEGYFWKYYNYGLEHTHNCVTIDWADPKYKDDLDSILSPEQLAEYQSILPKNVFKTEYLGEFVDGQGIVFEGFKEVIEEHTISPSDKLFVGIDWSNQVKADSSVVSIFNQKGNQVFLWHRNDLSPLKQIDNLFSVGIEPYLSQISAIVCESNSIGKPYTDLLRERLPNSHKQKIIEFNTSNSSKADIVGQMQVALESKEITLLPDEEQQRQFGYFSCDVTANKNVVYAAPAGLNDDIPMATMFALKGLRDNKQSGVYCIGSASMRKKR